MKKLLPAIVALALLAAACGPDQQQKEDIQKNAEEEVDEKVNEIMEQLDASAAEAATDTTDSVQAEAEAHTH